MEKEKLTEKEQQMFDGLMTEIKSVVAEHTKGLITEKDLEIKLSDMITKSMPVIKDDESFKAMESALKEQGLKIKSLTEGKPNENLSFGEQMKKAIEKDPDGWKSLQKSNGGFTMEFKVATTMLESSNLNSSAHLPVPVYEAGVGQIARALPSVINFCNYSTSESPIIIEVEKCNPDGTIVFVSEGSASTLIDFEFKTITIPMEEVPAHIKISRKMLDDIDFVNAEIQNELKSKVDLAVDSAVISGDGISPNIKGITEWAGAYTISSVKTTTPNNYDCIVASCTQIKTLNFMPNVMFFNPVDAGNMALSKDENGNYLIMQIKDAQGRIYGITPVETNQISAGYLLVGDMTRSKVREKGSFMVEFGYDADDFTKGLITCRGKRRLCHFIQDVDANAFVYDTFANIKTAILLT